MKVEMKKENNLLKWIKRYGTYCMAGILVVAIALTITLTSEGLKPINSNVSEVANPIITAGAEPVLTFTLPMLNATVLKGFSSTDLYKNNTLGWWEYHDGVDLTSDDLAVLAVASGKVSNVFSTHSEGLIVVITHANNFKSQYGCLDSAQVEIGDIIKRGDRIGTAGTSANNESADGNHLHFELFLNDQNVDPSNYLDFENK